METLYDIVEPIEAFAPVAWQEEWDNAGWQVAPTEPKTTPCSGVMAAFDLTEEVLRQAVDAGCNLVVCHHPLFFRGVKRLVGATVQERIAAEAIRSGVAVYAAHTNLDVAPGGVSGRLAERLGLREVEVLAPRENGVLKLVFYTPEAYVERVREAVWEAGAGCIGRYEACSFNAGGTGTFRAASTECRPFVGRVGELCEEREVRTETVVPRELARRVVEALRRAHPYEEPAYDLMPTEVPDRRIGLGCVGELPEELPMAEFLERTARTIGASCLKHSPIASEMVRRVAVCGGSGAEFIPAAMAQGAQVYLTADLKYHDFQQAEGRITLVDGGHFETERQAVDLFCELISKKFPNFAVRRAEETGAAGYFFDGR
ncbi:Nif3-like dinuclear metal center hexameric protein [uncultured Rikenella sp.]|uniref:Nif3-like dinuclear metal center hexameric protein n=1 Tax=uncultured Rikenella sp. TaxID=368003 RepID=UPI0025DE491A|nr:Nif3-like dinuclear metal center hexameric protein [uncultured Rikenella sp.]